MTSPNRLAAFLFLSWAATAAAAPPERWFYAYVDLRKSCVEHSEEKPAVNYGALEFLDALSEIQDAKYGVVVLSSHFLASEFHLRHGNPHADAVKVQANLAKIARACQERGIEIIPEVMPVGSSGSILSNNPMLAEGTPVCDCEYVVATSEGALVADVAHKDNLVAHGDMAAPEPQLFEAWNIQQPSPARFHREEDGTLRIDASPDGKAAQFGQQNLQVKPWHQYRLRYRLKTSGLLGGTRHGGPKVAASRTVAGEVSLLPITRVRHPIGATQDWTDYVVQLNTYESKVLSLQFEFDRFGENGKLWIDDVVLENVGAVNLLRRPENPATTEQEGLPITVKTADGTVYNEGVDFVRWEDPTVGQFGDYRHTQPPCPIRIPAGSRIHEGDRLLVSYYHAALPSSEEFRVCCSARHPDLLALFQWQARRLNELLAPRRWLINHDEVRAMGHDPQGRGDSPHRILGENLQACRKILEEVDQEGKVIVVSDMYDPHHNAVPRDDREHSFYPMVNGSFAGSAEFLVPPLTIWNWSLAEEDIRTPSAAERVRRSFAGFQSRQLTQVVAGFYDMDATTHQEVHDRARAHFAAVKLAGVVPAAVCYYTNKRQIVFLKDFATAADETWP